MTSSKGCGCYWIDEEGIEHDCDGEDSLCPKCKEGEKQ